jgi:hypothetical protein
MLNPGTNCSEAYMNISDSIVIFENPYSTFSTWYPPAWAGKYDSGRLCVMLTGCPASPSFIPQTIQKLLAYKADLEAENSFQNLEQLRTNFRLRALHKLDPANDS